MSQPTDSDYSQPSGASGTAIRTNEADYFQGILTKNSGTTAPSTTFAGMWWIDTSQTPPELNMRNQANTAWDTVAEIDATNGVALLSEGNAVVGLGNTSSFTASQTIDVSGGTASLVIKSTIDTGLASFLDLGFENVLNVDTIGFSLDMRVTDNTSASEDAEVDLGVIRAGSMSTKITIGDTVAITGTLNATTLQQGGTSLATLIENEISSVDVPTTTATTRTIPTNLTAGDMNTFTGSSASTYTVNSGTAGDVYGICNDGTADITFAAGGGVTIIGGTTLGQQKICTVWYRTSTRAFIYGENA